MIKFKFLHIVALVMVCVLGLSACKRDKRPTSVKPGKKSTVTGSSYGKKRANGEEGGFALKKFKGQPAGPNLVLVEGGRMIMGTSEEDVINVSHDNLERTVTVATFFMDETEIANIHWLEYLHYLYTDSGQDVHDAALPDTLVWVKDLAYNDPYVEQYLRYPGFRYFPVVGVSWKQCSDYAKWRSNTVNNALGMKAPDKATRDVAKAGERLPIESGVVLPDYRLPTEAEWEYAAKALVGTQYLDEMQDYSRIYPWDGHSLRNPYGREMGFMLANYKRGRGDYAGIAGKLNDAAMITDYIYQFPPNDYGLYNMAGNVNEWVWDIYRPSSFEDVDDLNPIRRDDHKDPVSWYNREGGETLIDDRQRVFKGGSWRDVAYWLSPGTRRYMDQDSSTSTVGFRCAMIKAGSNR
ncbi:MAG: gliding motility lipoprotein GldJ [Cytophagales bacterium]|nr:MAG: gliding motility lipoprotein GldJ [Cytophagales bacterium]TAF59662.1 MAG: gliding motility lipoprotein GldJ [Cytophagales bacterium]